MAPPQGGGGGPGPSPALLTAALAGAALLVTLPAATCGRGLWVSTGPSAPPAPALRLPRRAGPAAPVPAPVRPPTALLAADPVVPTGSRLGYTEVGIGGAPPPYGMDFSTLLTVGVLVVGWLVLAVVARSVTNGGRRAAVPPSPSNVTTLRVGEVRVRRALPMELPAVAAIMQGTLFRMPGAVSEVKPTDVPAGLLGMHTMRAEAERETRALRERIRRTRGAIDEGHRPSFEELVQLNEDRRQVAALQMPRMSAILVAEATHTRARDATPRIVGCATVFLNPVHCALDPPAPPFSPNHFYVSNVAVCPEARRQGVARRLLRACEVLCQRWGHPYVTLHVEAQNTAALTLYQSSGYAFMEEEDGPGQLLLVKRVAPPAREEVSWLQVLSGLPPSPGSIFASDEEDSASALPLASFLAAGDTDGDSDGTGDGEADGARDGNADGGGDGGADSSGYGAYGSGYGGGYDSGGDGGGADAGGGGEAFGDADY